MNTHKKTLIKDEVMEVLAMRKTHKAVEVAQHFGITAEAVRYHQRKWNAWTNEEIDRALKKIFCDMGFSLLVEAQKVG